jgi:hypothetical protein
LRKKNLLKSKSYGFIEDEGAADYFWSLQKGKPLQLAIEELSEDGERVDLTPPREDIHASRYKHERECADVFVSLVLTGQLFRWEEHKRLNRQIVPDRVFKLGKNLYYLENERGSKIKVRVKEKIENYTQYFRETKNEFNVLFLVKDEKALEDLLQVFEEMKTRSHYQAAVLSDFVSDPLEALITHRFETFRLSNTQSNRDSSGLE